MLYSLQEPGAEMKGDTAGNAVGPIRIQMVSMA